MSYYDPLLEELSQLDQPNYLTQSGQAMSMRGAPINAGGGFWSNLAAQLVPGLLGAGMSYIGQQQNRGAEADLLEAAKLGDSQQVADSLISTGHEGLAARVLMAAKEQEALALAQQAKLQQTMAYDAWKMDKSLEGKKELEGIKSSRIGANAANKMANDILVAQITAQAGMGKEARDFLRQSQKDIESIPSVKRYDDSLSRYQAIKSLIGKGGDLSSTEAETLKREYSRLISDEAVQLNELTRLMPGGFTGKAEDAVDYYLKEGRKNPEFAAAFSSPADKVMQGRAAAAQKAQDERLSILGEIAGPDLPVNFSKIKRDFSPTAKAIADVLVSSEAPKPTPPTPEGTLKPVTVPHPRDLKDGEITSYMGKQYIRINGQVMEGG